MKPFPAPPGVTERRDAISKSVEPMITVHRAASGEALSSLAVEWNALVDRDPSATPFHRPGWLIPWWRHFGSGELHALTFRRNDQLAGILPMFVHQWQGRRQVTMVGNGVTDFLGLTAEPTVSRDCTRLALDYLRNQRWDVCEWADLRSDSPLIAAAYSHPGTHVSSDLPCTSAPLPPDPDAYAAILPHGLRRTIRLAERRLERDGDLRYETLRGDPGRQLLEDLYRLHESRWADRGGPESMLDHPPVQQFLAEAASEFAANGKLRLYAMRYRGEIAAVILALLDKGRAWGYITGMDPSLSRFSPGSLVLGYAIRDAIREGASAWEFLRGDESYKFQWGARTIEKRRVRIERQPARCIK